MSNIWDKDRLYDFLLPYINRSFRRAYRKVEYHGLENIPTDGAVIFAPNHANTLMDALAVLSIENRKMVFVARADIFRKKLAAKALAFLKIMPIYRQRDGLDTIKMNEAIFLKCEETLSHGVPFCILPEGTHRTMHSLLPLHKGIARIALGTVSRGTKVYIVPTGLEYEDYFRYRSRLLVNVGRPICIQSSNQKDKEELISEIMAELTTRMKETIIYIPDNEDYAKTWDLACRMYGSAPSKPRTLFGRLEFMQDAVSKIASGSVDDVPPARPSSSPVIKAALLTVTFPLFLAAAVVLSPSLLITAYIKRGLRDRAFLNAIRFVCYTLVNPTLLLIVCAALLAVLPWWLCLLIYLFSFAAPAILHDWINKKLFTEVQSISG